tara:strand:- start:244 stop:441 length:198 start_codon:yes stop_codon:yes gene_type:complete
MDAWKNQRNIEHLKIELEKQMLEMKTKYAALYKYMEIIDTRTKDCRPAESKEALKAVTKPKRKKK